MNKPIIGSIIAIIVLAVLSISIYANLSPAPAANYGSPTGTSGAVATPSKPVAPTKNPVATPPASQPTAQPAANTFTLADVATHNSASSCYAAVSGSVYDLTSWISEHPGGTRAILGMCGRDATSAFIAQHGGQARPASELAAFQIGTLVP